MWTQLSSWFVPEKGYKIDVRFLDEYNKVFIVKADSDVGKRINSQIYPESEARRIAQQILHDKTWGKLSHDTRYKILTFSDPKDVFNLCQTEPDYRKLCNNDMIFKNLLQLHYPNEFMDAVKPYK